MDLKDSYDVVIVGSGPAGAGAAKALTESGLSALIVERAKLPRYKMCSGIVFPTSREFIEKHFGDIPDEIKCDPPIIKGNRICLNNDAPIMDTPFALFDAGQVAETEGFNTWRSDLDLWLCRRTDAQLVGDCWFDDYDSDDQGYIVKLRHAGENVTVRSKYIIAGDGTFSRVRKKAFPEFDDAVMRLPNYEEIYTGKIDLEPGWLYLFMDRSVTGYFATVFHKDDKIVVVTGVQQKDDVKEYFQAFRKFLEEKHGLVVDETVANHGIVLTDMSAKRNYCLGKDGILLTGEAGGFLRGGEGITSSLISGYEAGRAVLESVKTGKPAIDHFKELASDEMARCNQVHAGLEAVMGFNVFTRD